jgi:hypothetical protein
VRPAAEQQSVVPPGKQTTVSLPFVRKARLADVPALERLIAASARALGADDYRAEQIEAALQGAWGVDTEIIRDDT